MAVTRAGQTIRMTALNDTYTGMVFVRQIRCVGKDLIAGDRLTIRNTSGSGAVLVDHYVTAAIEDFVVLDAGGADLRIENPYVSALPTGATVVIVVA